MLVLAVIFSMTAPAQGKGARGLATITGTVRDNKGLPLAGAVIQLIREGANQLVKQTRTAADGSFSARIPAGRYSLKAIRRDSCEMEFNRRRRVLPQDRLVFRAKARPLKIATFNINN